MKPWEVFGLALGALALLAFVGGLMWACQSPQDARDAGVHRGQDLEADREG